MFAEHFAPILTKRDRNHGYQYREQEEQVILNFITSRRESWNAPFSSKE